MKEKYGFKEMLADEELKGIAKRAVIRLTVGVILATGLTIGIDKSGYDIKNVHGESETDQGKHQ